MPDITEELCSRLINKLFWLIVMQGVLTYTLYLATQHLSTNQILSAKIASVFFIRTGCCKNQIEILRQATQITDVWDNLFMGSSNKIPLVQWQLEKKLLLSWKLTEWTCFLEVRASHGPGLLVTHSLIHSLTHSLTQSHFSRSVSCKALYSPVLSRMVRYGLLWSPMVSYGPLRSLMVPYCLI